MWREGYRVHVGAVVHGNLQCAVPAEEADVQLDGAVDQRGGRLACGKRAWGVKHKTRTCHT